MNRRLTVASLVGLLCAVAGCSTANHPSAPSAAASPSTTSETPAVGLPDPAEFAESVPEGKLVGEVQGRGGKVFQVPLGKISGDFVIAVTCTGKGSMQIENRTASLILGMQSCAENSNAIYNSRGTLRSVDAKLQVKTPDGVNWRIAMWKAPTQ